MLKIDWKRSGLGLTILAAIGILTVLLGYYTGKRSANSAQMPDLHASASNSTAGSILSTGYYSGNSEAVYYLESQSGRLSAAVLARDEASFRKMYSREIRKDLEHAVQNLKIALPANPQFIMITGDVDVRKIGAREMNNVSKSFLYVAEVNTGIVFVYALPVQGDPDLQIQDGEILLWTWLRMNKGLNGMNR
ncbi:MAG: hypothetical protein Q4G69_03385 [Planctomycetia bacterium]|nr:hypothetical protein [Planctomycetia bacterium]